MLTLECGSGHNEDMHRGQALVVVLLVLGMAMTVGLSVASRSVTEVSVSTTQEESARALEAAEAGVERAVSDNTAGTVIYTPSADLTGGASYTTEKRDVGGSSFITPFDVSAGDVVTLNLNSFGVPNPFIGVCWGKVGSANPPAIELMVYVSESGETMVHRINLDANAAAHTNNFISTGINANQRCGGTVNLAYGRVITRAELGLSGLETPLLLRARMLYNSTPEPLAFQAQSGSFSVQARAVTSSGQSGDAVQKVAAVSMRDDLPPMFDSALFSGTGLVK